MFFKTLYYTHTPADLSDFFFETEALIVAMISSNYCTNSSVQIEIRMVMKLCSCEVVQCQIVHILGCKHGYLRMR